MTWLGLSSNQLSGTIPDFSNLPNLTVLGLSWNQLSGTIPNLNWSSFSSFSLNNNCGLVAFDEAQATVLTSKYPDWQTRNSVCPSTNTPTATTVKSTLHQAGLSAERIFYLADVLSLNPDDNPATTDVDAIASRERLEYALTRWPLEAKLGFGPDRALTLYLLDHGDKDKFFVNGRGETISPDDLNGWLNTIEAAVPGLRVNVIIDACLSGSFILPPQSISKAGRVIIASTTNANNAYTSRTNSSMAFSQLFVQALANQQSLYHSFETAKDAANSWHFDQLAWLDDNGDGFASNNDGLVAQQRGFAFVGSFANQAEPPYSDGLYQGIYTGFSASGEYRLVIYATDENGAVSQPQVLTISVGTKVYLPIIVKLRASRSCHSERICAFARVFLNSRRGAEKIANLKEHNYEKNIFSILTHNTHL